MKDGLSVINAEVAITGPHCVFIKGPTEIWLKRMGSFLAKQKKNVKLKAKVLPCVM